jgi:hypothetical protein
LLSELAIFEDKEMRGRKGAIDRHTGIDRK